MDDFNKLLVEATAAIPPEYLQVPVAGLDVPAYRERVYCYELYHQLRARWPEKTHLSLGGEVDKKGHPLIRGNDLDNRKPDLLVHEPGDMGGNYAVIEVKPAEADSRGVAKDLRTLTAFLERGAYARGLLLVYGDQARLPWFAAIVGASRQAHPELALELWWHPSPGEGAFRPL
jgi:hypothetical protein